MTHPTQDKALRTHLLEFLRGGSAHADAATAFADVPASAYAAKPNGAPYSSWQLLEHIRFTLHDLLEFCKNPEYVAPDWPADYWPKEDGPADEKSWKQSTQAFSKNLTAFEELVEDPETDLYARIPWGDGQTILREVLLAGDHNSYHLGQLILIRKQLGDWK